MGPDLDTLRHGTGAARYLGAASIAAIALCVATPAAAQPPAAPAATPAADQPQTSDAAAPEGDAIVVTGFRGSLARALNMKQRENASTDSILAEDIGKFPDLNLSESIQRVPGVALQRDGGEGRQITVRGLGPQFTRVRINGMEALTTAGGADA
jgi:outer membrane receptor for ferrienterochelin and colicin